MWRVHLRYVHIDSRVLEHSPNLYSVQEESSVRFLENSQIFSENNPSENILSRIFSTHISNTAQYEPLTKVCVTIILQTFKYTQEEYQKFKKKAIYL
jgi:hypothetical protein